MEKFVFGAASKATGDPFMLLFLFYETSHLCHFYLVRKLHCTNKKKLKNVKKKENRVSSINECKKMFWVATFKENLEFSGFLIK